jgi:uncharacterized protein (DUF2461 family)
MAADQLARFRAAVDEPRSGEELRRRLSALDGEGLTVAGELLATRPRGVPAEHPRLDLLRHRSLYAWRRWPGEEELLSPGLVDLVAVTWRRLTPLLGWLTEHVGPSLAR